MAPLLEKGAPGGHPCLMAEIEVRDDADHVIEIESETGFAFAYNSKKVNLNHKVSMSFSNSDLGSILMDISEKSDLKFKRINNYNFYNQLELYFVTISTIC